MKSDHLDGRITGLANDAVLRVPVVASLILRRGFEGGWCLQAYVGLVRGLTYAVAVVCSGHSCYV